MVANLCNSHARDRFDSGAESAYIHDLMATDPNKNRDTRASPRPGDRMADGTVCAGISPQSGKPLYAMPSDESIRMSFNEAADFAARLETHGHNDWRLPTLEELNILFNNRAAIGGFNTTGEGSSAWYWSSTEMNDIAAYCERFSDGFSEPGYRTDPLSIRFIRTATGDEMLQPAVDAEAKAQADSAREIREQLREKAPRIHLGPRN